MPGFRADAVKEKSASKRGFLPNSIPSNTELRGVEGKVPAKHHTLYQSPIHSTYSKTVNYLERLMSKVAHSYSGG